jgi:protein-tyrosine phosphatase
MEKSKPSKVERGLKIYKNILSDHQSNGNRILNFYPLRNTLSKISCHGKPNGKEIKYMKMTFGVNYVLTLLHKKEEPEIIKKICSENSIDWKQIELQGANMPYLNNKATQSIIITGLEEAYTRLSKDKLTMFIHCAAGIHRTGTIIYCLLRMFEETPDSALKALEYIRKETREKVGENRIELAEKILVPILLKKIKKEDNVDKFLENLSLESNNK